MNAAPVIPIPVVCSWCDTRKLRRHGVLLCPNCDKPTGVMPPRTHEQRSYQGA